MITTEQYCQLTSVIKLWIANCKCNRKKTMLLRMLYYLYHDKSEVREKTSMLNFTNSIVLEEKADPNIDIENKNKIDTENVNNDQNVTVNESLFKAGQLRRKDISDYPESIRYKIQFFESMSTKQVNRDNSWSTEISKSHENTSVEVVTCPPPVVVGMILKQNSGDNGIKDCGKSDVKVPVDASNPMEDTYFFDKRNSFQNSSSMSSKNKGNERFLINVLEPRTTKSPKKLIDINKSIITMDSQLYIKPTENDDEKERDTICESARILNDSILDLVRKAYDQSQIMKQAIKAVEACRQSKVFYDSIQRAEAERILLTASLKRAHYLQQIDKEKLQYPYEELKNTADLTISNIKFPFNIEEIDSKRRSWYLVTCVTDSRFYISTMLELNLKRSQLQVPEMYTFEGVSPDFKIKLHVYELNSDNADRKKSRRIHQKLKQKILRGKHLSNATLEDKTQSAFKKCGWLELTISNLSQNILTLNKKLEGTPLSVVHLSASAFSQALNLKHSGFLTIGAESDGHLVWDKNWCKLLNSILHFWSNPSEESLNSYKQFIDLRHCVIINIHNVCLRPNTLALESSSVDQASGTSKYFLSCDTLEEIEEWKRCISSILDTFKGWKALMYV